MATMELPNLKTLVEKTDKGTLNVWFKYANVSESFVTMMRNTMESKIYDVNIKGIAGKPIELPKDEVSNLITTLIDTVRMLDKESALVFIKANQSRTDSIGYIPLLWAAAKYAGIPDEAVAQNINNNPGCEKHMYESLVQQFAIPIA